MKRYVQIYMLIFVLLTLFLCSADLSAAEVRGLWVECEGSNETLSSPAKLDALIDIAKRSGVNTIFLQVYRHNRSWYNSELADTTPFDVIFNAYKIDPVAYTILKAHKEGIKIHLWINVLRIGKELDTPIIKKLGRDAITRDGRGVSLTQYPVKKLPDGGYWLDPGDLSVRSYTLQVVEELLKKYPDVDGIHLDYIRYSYTDITPGSQFSDRNDLGYGKVSVARFTEKYGYSPLKMDLSDKNLTQQWDDWRRAQITNLVADVSSLCKKINIKLQVSCAVQPWSDRAYLTAYQDWVGWMKSNAVDFVVLMNYSIDRKIVDYLAETAIKIGNTTPAYIGLGAYMMLKYPLKLYLQIEDCQKLDVHGIVLFSYDALLQNKEILRNISKSNWWEKQKNK